MIAQQGSHNRHVRIRRLRALVEGQEADYEVAASEYDRNPTEAGLATLHAISELIDAAEAELRALVS